MARHPVLDRWLTAAVLALAAALIAAEVVQAALALAGSERFAATGAVDDFGPYGVSSLVVITLLLTGVLLVGSWLASARRLAELAAPEVKHARASWWAYGGWLVPVVNLWFPYQYLRDVLRGLREVSAESGEDARVLGWWWSCWLGWLVTNRLAANTGSSDAPLVPLASLGVLETLNALFAVAAGVSWVVLVRRVAAAAEAASAVLRERSRR